jgi:DeoR/GlpR family transcriptional regulator of sugar metabolism
VQFVGEQGFCTILELSQLFGVSEMTIRRDVARIVTQGRLRGFHGGVGSLSPLDLLGVDYRARDLSMSEAKRAIAARAREGVTPRSVIALDAGTTGAQLAAILPSDQHLTVISPSLPVVSSLSTNAGVEIICLGGVLHPESLSFSGPSTLAAISNLHIETLFLAASGLNVRGVFCGNGFDAITKRALIDVSDTVVLIADSSKFTTSAMVRTCEWDAIDRLIVDNGLRNVDEQMLAQYDMDIDKVAVEPAAAAGGLELAR